MAVCVCRMPMCCAAPELCVGPRYCFTALFYCTSIKKKKEYCFTALRTCCAICLFFLKKKKSCSVDRSVICGIAKPNCNRPRSPSPMGPRRPAVQARGPGHRRPWPCRLRFGWACMHVLGHAHGRYPYPASRVTDHKRTGRAAEGIFATRICSPYCRSVDVIMMHWTHTNISSAAQALCMQLYGEACSLQLFCSKKHPEILELLRLQIKL